MKKFTNILANLSIVIGVILLISPVSYFLYSSYLSRKEGALVRADADRETEILSKSPFAPNAPVSFPLSYSQDEADPASFPQKIETNIPVVAQPDTTPRVEQTQVRRYGDSLRIDSIGINTEIVEADSSEFGLAAGVWRVPSFSTPDKSGEMTVLIAHRWGEDSVSWYDRTTKLFYYVPNLTPGDIITVGWRGTEYKYRVTYLEDSTYATRTADLMLVTCRYLSSDIRVLVYAERI